MTDEQPPPAPAKHSRMYVWVLGIVVGFGLLVGGWSALYGTFNPSTAPSPYVHVASVPTDSDSESSEPQSSESSDSNSNSNSSDSASSDSASCGQYLALGAETQESVARVLLNGARRQSGVSDAASPDLVSEYAVQIAKLCSAPGYRSLNDGSFEAAAAIYTALPDVWND